MFVPYVELHAHSAFSFLDGASLPEELAAAAVELGYEAMALTDHNGVSGSMEFAQAARPLGLRAIHGVEIDVLDVGDRRGAHPHVTLLVEDAARLAQPVPDRHARPRARPRDPREPPPAVPLETLEEHAAGLVCLSGCADHGVARRADAAPAARRLRARPPAGRAPAPVPAPRPGAQPRAGRSWRARLGVPAVATGNVHAHARSRAPLQDAFVALRHHLTLDASEPVRRGNTAHVLATPAAMAARFEGHRRRWRRRGELAERLRFDLTADLGYRYPGAEDPQAPRKLAELCWATLEERYPPGVGRATGARTRGWRRSCG